jgi:hypothetical protein
VYEVKALTDTAIDGVRELSKRFEIPLRNGKGDFSVS